MRAAVKNLRFLTAILLSPLALGGCISAPSAGKVSPGMREFYVPEVYESLYGTWVNPDYASPGPAAKVVIYPWGLIEWFAFVADRDVSGIGTSLIVGRRTDDAGNTWYRELRRIQGQDFGGGRTFVLSKISPDERTLEFVTAADRWPAPSELGQGANPTYVVYRRLE